ncbi:MAG: TonB family protein [Nitrospirae bacterium]|nr:TonB family protein [Nitrospirota bacterium]
MNSLPWHCPAETQLYLRGWALSTLVHGLAAGAAVALMADLRLAPQPEPFKWDVSVIETPTPQPIDKPTPPQSKPAPPTPPPTETQVIEPQPVMQAVQTVQAVQQVIHQEVQEVRPVVQATQVVNRTVHTIETPQQTVPMATTGAIVPVTQPAIADAGLSAQHEPSVISRPAVEATQAAAMVQERTVTREAINAPIEQASARELPVRSAPATKVDYGWLAETLWGRVEQLKRYPHMARMNRWEGRVVLRVVIKEDGQLLDLAVAESSGHSVLDQDALEILRQASPLTLKHPLGKPQVVVQVPISYKLR